MKETPDFIALQKELLWHKYLYYVVNSPTISDYQFDMLEESSFKMARELGFRADKWEDAAEDERHHIHWMIGFKGA